MFARCRCPLPLLLLLFAAASCMQNRSTPQAKAALFDRVPLADGVLAYTTHGGGEPVLLIHGSLLADVFTPMLNDPALREFRLITYHRRGYGASTRASEGFSIAQQAADAVALLDRLGATRAHIAGHSYGGAVALELARRYPRRVASLILLEASAPSFSPGPARMDALNEAFELYRAGDARGAVIHFANTVSPGAWDALAAAGQTAMQEQAVKDAATFFEIEVPALPQWQFTAEDAKRISAPALVVYGAESPPQRRQNAQSLAEALPNAQVAEIFGAGHELQMKQPHAVAAAIGGFLRKNRIN